MFFNEDLIQFIWSQQLFDHRKLQTKSGESILIIHPGILNRNSGPDFENAKIKINDTLFAGAVEIHVNSSEWYSHGHHEDENYNQVVLHVCYRGNDHVVRLDQTQIPTLFLEPILDYKVLHQYHLLMENQSDLACSEIIKSIPQIQIRNTLDRMITERLEFQGERIKQYLNDLNNDWASVLFISICRAFGNPVNSLAFEELGYSIPFKILVKHIHNNLQVEALLFGQAGLLLAPIDNPYYLSLVNEYAFLRNKYQLNPISAKIKTGRMRPHSLPWVKLAQLCAVLSQSNSIISEILDYKELKNLTSLFQVEASPFWLNHYSFQKESIVESKKLSEEASQRIIVNAVFPFLFLFFSHKDLQDLKEKVLTDYSEIKAENNYIISIFRNHGVKAQNGSDSQALLHLYKTYCTFKRCLDCSIGKKILSKTNGRNKT